MIERWKIEVEVTFTKKPSESEHQAQERIKIALNRMVHREPDIKHYHFLKLPQKCFEFD